MAAIKIPKRQNLVIAFAVLVVVLSVVLIYVQASALSSLRAEVEEEEMALLAAQARLNTLMQHRNKAEEYDYRFRDAKRKIPDQAGEDEILRYIHRLADDSGLTAVEIRFDGRTEAEDFIVMPLSITLEGGFQDTRIFLRQLRNGDRAIRVDDIRLNRMGEAGASLRINISANAFYNDNN